MIWQRHRQKQNSRICGKIKKKKKKAQIVLDDLRLFALVGSVLRKTPIEGVVDI